MRKIGFKNRNALHKGLLSVLAVAMLSLVMLLGAACGVTSSPSGEEAAHSDLRVVGYLPDWSYRAYENMDFTRMTHINIAFCNPSGSGGLSCGIPDNDLRAIVTKAHKAGAKVIAALGGGGYCEPYRELIATETSRQTLNDNIEAFCEKFDLDGVDLDIELASSDSIWKNYPSWISGLRTLCDSHGWLLSTATAQWVAGSTSKETFALFDYVNVMAYDDDGDPSSHSSYEFAVACIEYFHVQKGVPAKDVVLGVPFYGRGYDNSGNLDWNSYKSFAEIVQANASLYESDVYNGVAYNGAQTMRKKCALARDYGGIMIWEVTLDAGGDYSLLKLINSELYSPSVEV